MADPAEPSPSSEAPPPPPPPFSEAPSNPGSEPSSIDLPPNVAAAIACIPLIGGIIMYLLEKRNSFVRFYAMQSIIFGGAWLLLSIVFKVLVLTLAIIPFIGWFFAALIGILWFLGWLAFLVLFIITVFKAFSGERWHIPYIGPLAEKQMSGGGI